ncbi:hypothetical protein AB0A66_23100 [Streptomyces longwoodensis]|uniref:hypothetical protein n=1 Tax=Streptomyces longwoodensis TaxID=68231 RepID=UPI003402D6A9
MTDDESTDSRGGGHDGIAWLGERWAGDGPDPLLGVQAGLAFAEGIAPQDLAVVFGAVPWELPEPVSAAAKAVYDRTHPRTEVPDEPYLTGSSTRRCARRAASRTSGTSTGGRSSGATAGSPTGGPGS